MSLWEKVQAHKEDILRIAETHGAFNIRVFGSVAMREDGPENDIDYLVDLETGRSLLDQAGLLYDLGELLDCKVDVATEDCLKPRSKERILKETVPI